MFRKTTLAVDIGAGCIKYVFGTHNKIYKHGMLDTPVGSVADSKIINGDAIAATVKDELKTRHIKPTRISFSISGNDVITRHIEVPIMGISHIKDAVEWEVRQNLPDEGEKYYLDFEVQNNETAKRDKRYKVVVVALLKDRIEKYMEVADKLGLPVESIDISSNSTARVFKKLTEGKNKLASLGILDIGFSNTSITLIDNGMLSMERQVHFGLDKFYKEIMKTETLSDEGMKDLLYNNFGFEDLDKDVNSRLNSQFDNLFATFQKVIQFYSTGKVDKTVSRIYLAGGGSTIRGVDKYIEKYFESPTTAVYSRKDIDLKMKLPKDLNIVYYINAIGLLLREEQA